MAGGALGDGASYRLRSMDASGSDLETRSISAVIAGEKDGSGLDEG